MKIKRIFFTGLTLCMLLPFTINASEPLRQIWSAPISTKYNKEPRLPVVQIDFNYTNYHPQSELSKRFGMTNGFGIGASYRWEQRIIAGFEFSPLWGGNVLENSGLDSITGPSGGLIDNNGNIGIVRLYMFGYHGNAYLGYLFNTHSKNPNTGILVRSGVGYLQHKIRHQHSINIMPQLEGEMIKGYDKLTSGIMYSQFIGFQYSSILKSIHFWAGISYDFAYTVNRRGYNYDTRSYDTNVRKDQLLGFKIGAMIPIFLHGKGEKEGSEIYFD
jgi:hypothetical protein